MRRLLAFALLLSPVVANEANDPAESLATAREELKFARGEWKRLARVEKDALKDARSTVATTAKGRALAPALLAAADLLEGARGDAGDDADLLAQMALSYRAMAEEIDRKVAPEAKARAAAMLEEGATEKETDEAKAAWRLVKRGDPRYRALACNMKELNAALASLGDRDGALGTALADVAKFNKALAPCFEGVETARPEPPEEDCPT
jgi:hypothetical protein